MTEDESRNDFFKYEGLKSVVVSYAVEHLQDGNDRHVCDVQSCDDQCLGLQKLSQAISELRLSQDVTRRKLAQMSGVEEYTLIALENCLADVDVVERLIEDGSLSKLSVSLGLSEIVLTSIYRWYSSSPNNAPEYVASLVRDLVRDSPESARMIMKVTCRELGHEEVRDHMNYIHKQISNREAYRLASDRSPDGEQSQYVPPFY